MKKKQSKPSSIPQVCPVVVVSVGSWDEANLVTLAWVGRVVSEPPVMSISIRPSRHSYPLVEKLGEFVINLPREDQVYKVDYCGTRSGKNVDKWKELGLTKEKASKVQVPLVKEFPVNIECKVIQKNEIGTHVVYFGEVLAVHVDEKYDPKNQHQLVYASGNYYDLKGAPKKKHGYSMKGK